MELTAEQRERIRPAMEEYEFYVNVQVFKATSEQLNQVLKMRQEIGIPYGGTPCANCNPDIFKGLYKIYNPQGRTHDQ